MIGKWIQKIKKNKRQLGIGALALLLVGVMGVNLLQNSTSTVYAANDAEIVVDPDTTKDWSKWATKSTENIGRIWTDKSVMGTDYKFSEGSLSGQQVLKGDSDFLVSLSTLASYSNERTTITTTNPIDIVMILDRSGSMDDNITTYTYTPTYNVNRFYTYFAKREDGSYVKIVQVNDGWGSYHWELDGIEVEPMTSESDTQSRHIQFYRRNESNETRMEALQTAVNNFIDSAAAQNAGDNLRISIISFSSRARTDQEFTAVTESNASSLKQKVNGLRASGDTYPDRALEQAKNEISEHGNPNAKKVVLFFTDGMPAEGGTDEFNDSIAAHAVNTANELKKSEQNGGYDASIYSVCIMEGADPSITDDKGFNAYMNAVSSNFPQATAEGYDPTDGNNRPGIDDYFNVTWGAGSTENDYYKVANDASELNAIFEDIFDKSTEDIGSGSPIEEVTEGGAGDTAGYLTFTDTLGSYTEITGNNMTLAFADQKFTATSTDGENWYFENGDTVVDNINGIYPGGAKLSTIEITVTKSDTLATGDVITVKIPASLIPMRRYDVNKNNSTLTVTDAYPLRLFYGVSVKEKAIAALNNPTASGNEEIYNAIKSTQISDDKKTIDFYSNNWLNNSEGTTIATFTPSEGNSFYYYPQTQLFIDESCTQPAMRNNIIWENTLYYKESYWVQTGQGDNAIEQVSIKSVTRSGADWNNIQFDSSENAYIDDHIQRLDKAGQFVANKIENSTQTASTVLSPQWEGNQVSQHLGNNGKISYPAPGELEISKTVDWGNASEQTKADKDSFTFEIQLYTEEENEETGEIEKVNLTGEYPYVIYENSDQIENGTGKIANNEKINLKNNQRVVIYELPNGAKFEVKEQEAGQSGFTTTYTYGDKTNVEITNEGKVEGTITGGSQQSIQFTNRYRATSTTLGTNEIIKVEKDLVGRDWRDDDEFIFTLNPLNNAPRPDKSNATITGTDTDHKVDLSNITFQEPGLFTYVIEEDNDTNPIIGIDYSNETYEVTITVVDDGNGQLDVSKVDFVKTKDIDGNPVSEDQQPVIIDNTVKFENNYVVDSIETPIDGTKIYEDKSGNNPNKPNKFEFKIKALGGYETNGGSLDNLTIDVEDVPMPKGTSELDHSFTVANVGKTDGKDTFSFPRITFDGNNLNNTYVYEITEVIPENAIQNDDGSWSLNGMKYDGKSYMIQIPVIEVVDSQGVPHIDATPNLKPEEIEFNNTYQPMDYTLTGDEAIHGTKILNGREIKNDETFYFQLTQTGGPIIDSQTNAYDIVLENPIYTTVTKDSGMNFKFDDLSFSRVGTYTFNVNELADDLGNETVDGNGLTYSKNIAEVSVVVSDKKDGTLEAKVLYKNQEGSDNTQAVFINTYEASMNYGAQGEGGINVTKTLENLAMNSNDFRFSITDSNQDDDVTVSGDDESFGNIPGAANEKVIMPKLQSLAFDQDDAGKIFTFIVDEVEPEDNDKKPGIIYDQSQYKVDIEVFDNGNGSMHTETTVTQIKDSNGNDIENPVPIINKANSDDENYKIPEFGFTNRYSASEVSLNDQVIEVTKKLEGRAWSNTDQFEFTLTPSDDTQKAIDEGNVVLEQPTSVTINKDTKDYTNSFGDITFKKAGTYSFKVNETIPSDATDNQDGTWTLDGVTYNSNSVEVKIVVEDNFNGSLVIKSVSYNGDQNKDAAEFVNTYKANGSTSVSVTKNLTGRDWMNEDSFDFTLEIDKNHKATLNAFENNQISIDGANDEGVANISISSADESKTKSFGNINFNNVEDGQYRFIVKETPVNDEYYLNGIKYSQAEYQVAVTVTDNGKGTLGLTSLITQQLNDDGVEGNKGTDYESAVFTNKYTSDSVTLTGDTAIHGTKTLTGRNSNPNEKFNFTLTEDKNNYKTGYEIVENGNVASVDTLKEGESAKFNFGDITFTKNGTYTFYVSENIPENAVNNVLDGVTYDSHVETVSVNVTEDYANHTLVAEVTYDQDGVAFTNTYDASASTGVPTEFSLTKVFEGKTWTTEDVFEFTLTAGENTAGIETPMPANPTVQVNAPTEEDGKTAKFDFGSISYDTVGDYHYTVVEVEGNNPGINYSENTASIIVHVSDNQHGGLVATAEVENGIFTNTYSSELDYGAQGGLQLVKNLMGHDLGDGQFGFTLNAEDSISIDKLGQKSVVVGNTADDMDENGLSTSTITLLDNLKFTQKDVDKTYTYTVRETKGGSDGYTNDETIYTVKITTEDNGSGTLTVRTHITGTNGTDKTYEYSQSKTRAETGVAQIVFENTYKSTTDGGDEYDNSVTLTGTKELTGRPMVDGEFSFQVLNSKGQVVSEATNGANGEVVFNPIHYTNTQLISDAADKIAQRNGNKYTYVYTVNEVTPVDEGTSIVKGSFTVTVNVTDNGDGTLTTDIALPEGGLAFKNAYGTSANAEVGINGTKYLDNNGTNAPDITGKYTFTITGSDGAPMPAVTTATNDASGYIDFGTIAYTMENVFGDAGQQSIVEQSDEALVDDTTNDEALTEENVTGSEENVNTYSEQRTKTFTYTITETGSVTGVTNDLANSKTVDVTVTDNGDGTISVSSTQLTFSFTNTYTPDPTDPTSPTDSSVTIKKTLEGKELSEKEFTFNMLNEAGEVVSTGTNTADGSVTLSGLTFDKVGTYNFTIAEVNDNKGGVEYDSTEYKAIAYVEDDATGKLKVRWEVTDAQGNKIDMIEFKNTYSVNPTSLTLGATKVLEGRELGDKEFLFVLSDIEGNVVEEAYNDATGKVEFSELVFDKAGTYNYTVTEKNTGAQGITYDDSVYNIQVNVVDNGNGTLNMKTTTTKDGEVASIVFRNKAEKDSVPEQPEKGDTSNTSTQTYAGLFTSLAVDAAALAGIATLLKKRNAKK